MICCGNRTAQNITLVYALNITGSLPMPSHWVLSTCPASVIPIPFGQFWMYLLFLLLTLLMFGSFFNMCSTLNSIPLSGITHLCTFIILFLKKKDYSVSFFGLRLSFITICAKSSLAFKFRKDIFPVALQPLLLSDVLVMFTVYCLI